ncbi:DHA2 family efflux MFS transporter permease subunit [Solilutibacter silvestris]|uniref:Drug resistance MFS transporter n=1 Tax=Solilutibacter silvestris TaxID=1645665 RepID=A0A2K1PY69_9GAMM|nr:DHA2 family efflux MFS transporter permease subunit [Lysobacter silvestris]PNS07723.1 drug resistance MFS transporter [Lysobacter silvestris]
MKMSRRLPLIVACALFIENMDSTVLATALPVIAGDFRVDPISLKLVLTTYLLALAVFIPISGWVADRFGARITFISAIAVFLLGSIGCAASGSLETMVVARFVQGMGGAMMVPVGRLVLLRTVSKSELVQALSWLTIPALVGPVAGPPLGGLITTYFNWRWIFLINLPMGLLGMLLAWRFIPPLKEPTKPLDWIGFLLSGIGLALTMFGVSTFGRLRIPLWASCLALLLGLVLLAAYVIHARRVPNPLLDLRLFRIPTFRAGVVGGSLFRIGIGAIPFLLPLMLQLGFGLTPLQSGMLTFISAVGAMFMKTIAAWIIRQWGFRRVLLFNAVLASVSLAIFGLFRPSTPHAVVMLVLLVSGCMRSLQFTSLNAISYADVDQVQVSQASSLAAMMQQLSVSMGVAVAGFALELCGWARHVPATDLGNFYLVFPMVATISLLSSVMMWRLPADAGAEMAGKAQAGHEVAEPKVEQRPAM